MTFAVLYGVSGASGGGEEYQVNERLFALATSRMLAAEDAPYALLTDANIEALGSQLLRSLIDAGQIVNVYADRHPDMPARPTYLKGGITGCISP